MEDNLIAYVLVFWSIVGLIAAVASFKVNTTTKDKMLMVAVLLLTLAATYFQCIQVWG